MSAFDRLRNAFGYVLLCMGVSRPAQKRQSPLPHPEGPKPSADSAAPPSAAPPESHAAKPGSQA
jgi:hypothetical protein